MNQQDSIGPGNRCHNILIKHYGDGICIFDLQDKLKLNDEEFYSTLMYVVIVWGPLFFFTIDNFGSCVMDW